MNQAFILVSSGQFVGNLSIQRCQSTLYAACLSAAGGTGVLYSGGAAPALAARCDGLLLAGGGDLHPACYGQDCADLTRLSIDPVRDGEEHELFEAFYARGKPVLGICRGLQAINVFLGGTLHQHVEGHADCCHPIQYSSLLRQLLDTSGEVNSYHHQTIDHVADSLSPAACTPDGTIEALVHPSLPILGVQWHPERLVPGVCEDIAGINHLPLFQWLCEQC